MTYTVFIHDGGRYVVPQQMRAKDITEWLNTLRAAAFDAVKTTGSAHCIYATKTYEDGKVEEIDLYSNLVLLDDDEFYKRTEAFQKEHPDSVVYAAHKHE